VHHQVTSTEENTTSARATLAEVVFILNDLFILASMEPPPEDLQEDPNENHNLAKQQPQRVTDMKKRCRLGSNPAKPAMKVQTIKSCCSHRAEPCNGVFK